MAAGAGIIIARQNEGQDNAAKDEYRLRGYMP